MCARCGADVGPDALYRLGPGAAARVYCAACARARHPAPDWRPRSTVCRACGRRLYYQGAALWPRHYCTEACARVARRARQRHPPAPRRRRCLRCRAEFVTTRPDARYCSGACRQAAYRERRRS